MLLNDWAVRWGIPWEAIADLKRHFGMDGAHAPATGTGGAERDVQTAIRLEAARKGVLLWRNNVGALKNDRGQVVRYGICNDTKALNEKVKSGDLIGIKPVTITPAMVGNTFGQFISREIKAPGWRYGGAGREPAQLRWVEIVTRAGGDAAFATGEGSL